MLGTSPFIRAAQLGRKAYEYRKMFFYKYAVSISVGITSEAEMEETYLVASSFSH
jgi:hypothetical protein